MQDEAQALAQDATLRTVLQGTAFTILAEQGDFWQIEIITAGGANHPTTLGYAAINQPTATQEAIPATLGHTAAINPTAAQEVPLTPAYTGYLRHAHCFINLPDLLPSAIYCNTNASASVMRSCGKEIPDITGQQLYQSRCFNPRLGKKEYTMPVLYHTAKKIAAAHKAALAQGEALVVYELFRMQQVQQRVVRGLWALAQQDPEIMAAITGEPWEISWFIATGISTHQRGMAMDVGLAAVRETQPRVLAGGMQYTQITAHEVCPMQTPIHELGRASASLAYPVTSRNDTDWRGVPDAPSATDAARRLRGYCSAAGLTPLASEWWHFNDLGAEPLAGSEQFVLSVGDA